MYTICKKGYKWSFDENGVLNSVDDQPAVIKETEESVIKVWYKDGLPHRNKGFAYIEEFSNGKTHKKVYKNGMMESKNKNTPAEILKNGNKVYRKHGVYERANGELPAIENKETGVFAYYRGGHLHRENGLPAIKDEKGNLKFYENGKLHNQYGPAVLPARFVELFMNKFVTYKEMQNNYGFDKKDKEYKKVKYYINGKELQIVRLLG